MHENLLCPKEPPLLLPSPATEVSPLEFILNAVLSIRSYDFIIFDDVSSHECRYLQFAGGKNGLILDFNVVENNDHHKYFSDIRLTLDVLDFQAGIAEEPMKYHILQVNGEEEITTLRANFGHDAFKVVIFVKLVYDYIFESDPRKAKVTLDNFLDRDEARKRGLTTAPQLAI